jgi:hypothetical protein
MHIKDPDELVDHVSDVILNLGKIAFSQVALPLPDFILSGQKLHSYLYPEILSFGLQIVHDKAIIFPTSPDGRNHPPKCLPGPAFETEFQAESMISQ